MLNTYLPYDIFYIIIIQNEKSYFYEKWHYNIVYITLFLTFAHTLFS